jgi:integrase
MPVAIESDDVVRSNAIEDAAEHLISSRKSENTRGAYRRDWECWCDHADPRGIAISRPTLVDSIGFREALRVEHEYGTASIARVLATLAFFYRAFQAAGLVKVNPFDRAWLPRDEVEVGKTRAVEIDDAQKVIAAVVADESRGGRRDLALLRLLYDTGTRRASVRNALRADLDFTTNTLRVIVKGGKPRLLPFTTECATALRAWFELAPESRYVFPSNRRDATNRPLNLATINRIVKERAAEAHVEHLHPHRFRAAFITDAYSAGIPERDIQTAAHHADASMTRRYDRGVRGQRVADQVAAFRKRQK